MPEDERAADLLASIDEEQRRLRKMLAREHELVLAQRPANGKWSVVENVRHLVFAEHAHLGRFIPGGTTKTPGGLTPESWQEYRKLRMIPPVSVGDALKAWTVMHRSTRKLAANDNEDLRAALPGHLRHLRHHIDIIEKLLRVRRVAKSG